MDFQVKICKCGKSEKIANRFISKLGLQIDEADRMEWQCYDCHPFVLGDEMVYETNNGVLIRSL